MDKTRVKGARPQNKKIANNERRPAPSRLCCKTLCPKEARWQRTHIGRRLYKPSKVIEENLLKAVREEVTGSQETATSFKVRRIAENTQEWKEMPLYGQFVRETEDQSNEETWSWLKQ